MYNIHYDAATGSVLGIRNAAQAYSSPQPLPFIQVNDGLHRRYMDEGQRYKVLGTDGKLPNETTTALVLTYIGVSYAEQKAQSLVKLDQSAAAAYVGGFYSEATGNRLYYDSDPETQTLLANVYQRTKETDWPTKVRYPGAAPAGKAPVRARPTASDPDTAKAVQLLDAAQLKTLIDDLDAAFFTIKGTLWTLQAQVAAATTEEALAAIKWPDNE